MQNSRKIENKRLFVIGSNEELHLFLSWILSDIKLVRNITLIIDDSVFLQPDDENSLKDAKIEFLKFNFVPRQVLNFQQFNRLYCQNLHEIINREFYMLDELMCFSSSPALLDYTLSEIKSRISSLSVFIDCWGFSELVRSYVNERLNSFDDQNQLYLEGYYLQNVDKIYLPDRKSYWFYTKATHADVYVSNYEGTVSNDPRSPKLENRLDLDAGLINDILILDWDTNQNFLALIDSASIINDTQRLLIWDPEGKSAELKLGILKNNNTLILNTFDELDLSKVTIVLNQLPSKNDTIIPFLKKSGARFKYFWTGLGSLSMPEYFDIHLTKDNLKILQNNKDYFEKYVSNYCQPVEFSSYSDGLVSICIPHFNRSDCVRRSLYSAIGQTYENIEIIVSDDGSSCEHRLILEKVIDQAQRNSPDRVVKLISSKNSYLGASRNRLVNAAHGEFILFLDDDNVAHPRLVETFMSNQVWRCSDIVSVIQARGPDSQSDCFFNYFFGEDDHKQCSMEDFFDSQFIDNNDVTPHFPTMTLRAFARNTICDGNCFVRKQVWHQLRGNSEVYGIGKEDYEFFFRAIDKGYSFTQINSPMIHTTISEDTMKKLNLMDQFALFRVHFGVVFDSEQIDYSDLYQRLIVSFTMQKQINTHHNKGHAAYLKNFLFRNIYLLLKKYQGGTNFYFMLRRIYFKWVNRAF